MRRIAFLVAGAAAVALLIPTGQAAALGGSLSGSFVCENTLVTVTGTAGTMINAAPQSFTSTVVMADSADAGTGASAQVTIAPAGVGTMPLSPPVALPSVVIDELQVRLDIYRSTTNSAVDITLPMDMSSGTSPVTMTAFTQAAGTAWAVPGPFQVTVPVTGAAGDRAWVRVKSFGFTWENTVDGWSGSTTCRLAAAEAFPSGPTTVEQPIFGALTPLSRQFPVAATDVNLSGTETQIRAQFADRVTFTGTTPPPTGDTCTVTNPTGCTTGQEITATVIAGTLTQQAAAAGANPNSTSITMRAQGAVAGPPYGGAASVTVLPVAQMMEGPLNPVTVTDVRGNSAGWSLTAELSGPLTEIGGGSIAESQAELVVFGCTPLAGSATHQTGAGGVLDSAVTLCGVDAGMDDSEGDSGSGQYTVTGRVDLEVPPFQRAGEYTSTLVITLT